MKKNKPLFVSLMMVIGVTLALSQDSLRTDYPFLYKVELGCQVSFDARNQLFSYNYVLTNNINNRGDVWIIQIDIARNSNSFAYDTVGLQFDSAFEERMFRRDYPRFAQRAIPVGIPKLPSFNWLGDLWSAPVAVFSTNKLFPRPGEIVRGFMLTSKALPGIRRLTVIPYFNIDLYFPSIEDTTATMSIAQMDSIRNAVNYYGWTVGPYAPPAVFDANVLLDTLTSFTARSRALGWLGSKKEDEHEQEKDDGELKELDKRLAEARTALTKGDSSKVRKELVEFVEKVEELYKESQKAEEKKKEKEVIMTSEAYALLKYNAEYLINKLPKKKK